MWAYNAIVYHRNAEGRVAVNQHGLGSESDLDAADSSQRQAWRVTAVAAPPRAALATASDSDTYRIHIYPFSSLHLSGTPPESPIRAWISLR